MPAACFVARSVLFSQSRISGPHITMVPPKNTPTGTEDNPANRRHQQCPSERRYRGSVLHAFPPNPAGQALARMWSLPCRRAANSLRPPTRSHSGWAWDECSSHLSMQDSRSPPDRETNLRAIDRLLEFENRPRPQRNSRNNGCAPGPFDLHPDDWTRYVEANQEQGSRSEARAGPDALVEGPEVVGAKLPTPDNAPLR
jgi:hypothetical protein